MGYLNTLQHKSIHAKQDFVTLNPKYHEIMTFNWEDNKTWTSFFAKMVLGLFVIFMLFPIFGSFVSLPAVVLMLTIFPIFIAIFGSYLILKLLTLIDTYYISDNELVIQTISLGKMSNRIYHKDDIDIVVVLVNGQHLESSSQEFLLWELDDPRTKVKNLIIKTPSDKADKAIKLRQGLSNLGIKVVDFHYKGWGICSTCITMPAKYEKDFETNCPSCDIRIRYY